MLEVRLISSANCLGWQVAGDANVAGKIYPDQSLYPANSGPELCRRINNALMRADQVECSEGTGAQRDWFRPIVADAEAGFGGSLNCFELMKAYVEAGAAGVHFEDQLGRFIKKICSSLNFFSEFVCGWWFLNKICVVRTQYCGVNP